MATALYVGGFVVIIGALLWTQMRHGRAFAVQMEALERVADANDTLRASQELLLEGTGTPQVRDTELVLEVKELQSDVELLRLAISEGIQHVERVENRIKATVRRARKELEELGHEHPGLEAEARELQLIDGGGSEGEGMPPVHQELGPAESSVPGVSPEQLRRARGF